MTQPPHEENKGVSDSPDWSAMARLYERDDSGSEMYYEFRELGTGTLAALVRQVAALPPAERARLVIDRGVAGTINIGDIMALAARADLPQAG